MANKTIPTYIMNVDDDTAVSYYAVTNLSRRELTVVDRVNGCWYWLKTFQGTEKKTLELVNENLPEKGQLQIRQIQKLARCHDLIPELQQRLDSLTLSVNAGYALSFLTDAQQQYVASFNISVSEKTAVKIKELKTAGNWSEPAVSDILYGNKTNDARLSIVVRKVKILTKKRIRSEDYGRADEIFTEALNLYFEKHPEEELASEENNSREP